MPLPHFDEVLNSCLTENDEVRSPICTLDIVQKFF